MTILAFPTFVLQCEFLKFSTTTLDRMLFPLEFVLLLDPHLFKTKKENA